MFFYIEGIWEKAATHQVLEAFEKVDVYFVSVSVFREEEVSVGDDVVLVGFQERAVQAVFAKEALRRVLVLRDVLDFAPMDRTK